VEGGLKETKLIGVRKGVCAFVDRFILTTYIDALKDMANVLLPPIALIADDKDVETKEIALATLGTLRARLGEQALEKYLEKLIPAKKTKVEEAQAKVKPSKYDKS
jgi:hypothetical protein